LKAKAKSKFSSVNTPMRIAEFKRQPAAGIPIKTGNELVVVPVFVRNKIFN
jgi:hypothetical protein